TLARCAAPPDQPSNARSSLTRSSTTRPAAPSVASTCRTSRITRSFRLTGLFLEGCGSSGRKVLELVCELLQLGAAGHHPQEVLAADLALRRAVHQPSAVEDGEAIADRVGVMGVVGDEYDADAAVARLQDVAEHDPRLLDAECRGRLVKDQHSRAEVD